MSSFCCAKINIPGCAFAFHFHCYVRHWQQTRLWNCCPDFSCSFCLFNIVEQFHHKFLMVDTLVLEAPLLINVVSENQVYLL